MPPRHERGGGAGVAQVGMHGDGAATQCFDFADDSGGFLVGMIMVDGDRPATPGALLGVGGAVAPPRAGDERNPHAPAPAPPGRYIA